MGRQAHDGVSDDVKGSPDAEKHGLILISAGGYVPDGAHAKSLGNGLSLIVLLGLRKETYHLLSDGQQ